MPQVAVVGAGVIGLTSAYELAALGDVTIFHDLDILETTSAMATAIWHVYLVDPRDQVHLDWSSRTLSRLLRVANDSPAAAVEMCPGVELFRTTAPSRPSWADIAKDFRMLSPVEMNRFPGRTWGYRISAPTANMHKYLTWLAAECAARGATFCRERIESLSELSRSYDLVVNATGLRAGELVTDSELYPVKGQYLVFEAAGVGLKEYIGDDEHPAGMAYIILRDGELMVGGTEEPHDWSLDFNQDVDTILKRATQFCPEIETSRLKLVRVETGLRP